MSSDTTTLHGNHMRLTEEPHKITGTSTELSEVMQQALRQLQQKVRSAKIIVRCSELPHVGGDATVWIQVIEELLQTIICVKTAERQLFLRIDCERMEEKLGFNKEIKKVSYQIQFHTNLQATENWYHTNKQNIEHCQSLLEKMQARLTVHYLAGNSCLFNIHIPV